MSVCLKLFKPAANVLSGPLSHAFKNRLMQDVFPHHTKITLFSPITGTSKISEVSNFRPLTFLNRYGKVAENSLEAGVN